MTTIIAMDMSMRVSDGVHAPYPSNREELLQLNFSVGILAKFDAVLKRWNVLGQVAAVGFLERIMNALFGLSEEVINTIADNLANLSSEEFAEEFATVAGNLHTSIVESNNSDELTAVIDEASENVGEILLPREISSENRSAVAEAVRPVILEQVAPVYIEKREEIMSEMLHSLEGKYWNRAQIPTDLSEVADLWPLRDTYRSAITEHLQLQALMKDFCKILHIGKGVAGSDAEPGHELAPDIVCYDTETGKFTSERMPKIAEFGNTLKSKLDHSFTLLMRTYQNPSEGISRLAITARSKIYSSQNIHETMHDLLQFCEQFDKVNELLGYEWNTHEVSGECILDFYQRLQEMISSIDTSVCSLKYDINSANTCEEFDAIVANAERVTYENMCKLNEIFPSASIYLAQEVLAQGEMRQMLKARRKELERQQPIRELMALREKHNTLDAFDAELPAEEYMHLLKSSDQTQIKRHLQLRELMCNLSEIVRYGHIQFSPSMHYSADLSEAFDADILHYDPSTNKFASTSAPELANFATALKDEFDKSFIALTQEYLENLLAEDAKRRTKIYPDKRTEYSEASSLAAKICRMDEILGYPGNTCMSLQTLFYTTKSTR
ncbi:MAG: hypothetical protein LBI34_00695 [Puniceicoccales bacterium]|nr:hypothetical protein [Puniceicoccales bacterium]